MGVLGKSMRILIIGVGDTGRRLVATFCGEQHDLVVVDTDAVKLAAVAAQYDLLTVQGEGADPHVLQQAQIGKADMLVAVTDRDEVNILACVLARTAGVPHKVARVSSTSLLRYEKLDLSELGVDLAINQKEECAHDIFNILEMAGALEVVELQQGSVFAVGKKVSEESPIRDKPLSTFTGDSWNNAIRLIGIVRGNDMIVPHGDSIIMAGDEIYFVGRPDDCMRFMRWMEPDCLPFSKVIIAGGGATGLLLAELLEKTDRQVVLLEHDPQRADLCSDVLNKAVILRSNALDQESIDEISVREKTAYVAVTGDEESNIIGCLLAARKGVSFTLARINKPEYVPVINNLKLMDRAVSSDFAMINSILHFVRGKNIESVAILHRLPGELLDVLIPENGKWAGKAIRDLRVPRGTIITTVSRAGEIHIATGDLELQAGDRLVLFAQRGMIPKIESPFKR
jgi:trk system potassium uptake protein TrkA